MTSARIRRKYLRNSRPRAPHDLRLDDRLGFQRFLRGYSITRSGHSRPPGRAHQQRCGTACRAPCALQVDDQLEVSGCSTGNLAGFAPFSIVDGRLAARRARSACRRPGPPRELAQRARDSGRPRPRFARTARRSAPGALRLSARGRSASICAHCPLRRDPAQVAPAPRRSCSDFG